MARILNFGSLNLDFVYQVPHLVKTGETLSATGYTCHAGGKGLNQSIALRQAGADICHAGKIGSDGTMLVDMLKQYGVNTQYIRVCPEKTGHAVIQVDKQGQNCILLFGGANQAIETADINTVLGDFSAGDVLVLQNEINQMNDLLHAGRKQGMKIILNPSPYSSEMLQYDLDMVDLFVLNEIEGEAMTGVSDSQSMGQAMQKRFPKAAILLTLGEAGSEYLAENCYVRQAAYSVPVVDTTAAGDTFLGYFVARTALGDTVEQALKLAAAAAAMAVSTAGAARSIPSLAMVKEAFEGKI